MRQAVTLARAPPVAPLLGPSFVAEIASDQEQVGAELAGPFYHRCGGMRISANGWSSRPEDAGFFQANLLARIPKVIHVIEIDAHQHRAVRIESIHRVES